MTSFLTHRENLERTRGVTHRQAGATGTHTQGARSIVWPTVLDWFRAERRRRTRENVYALRAVEPAQEDVFGEGLAPSLERALAALNPGEREVIALRVLLELDGRTAARVLGISETACSTRLSRALA